MVVFGDDAMRMLDTSDAETASEVRSFKMKLPIFGAKFHDSSYAKGGRGGSLGLPISFHFMRPSNTGAKERIMGLLSYKGSGLMLQMK